MLKIPNPNDTNEIVIALLQYILMYPDKQEELRNSFPNYISFAGQTNYSHALQSVRHLMFSKKYFPTAFQDQQQQIINRQFKMY